MPIGEPQVGDILGGKYRIDHVLGRGGMGIVFAATHLELEQKVAVKCLLAAALWSPEIVERFAREAKAAARVQGEHVARVIDVGRFEDGTPFMVMEHLAGRDLAREIEARGALPVQEAIHYVLQASEAIARAHQVQIVHRDLKPANLFLAETPGRRPSVKVLDFGISKVIGATSSPLTATSTLLGTPHYMSPEQLRSSKMVDFRCDVWALGVILYELIVGERPFGGDATAEIMLNVVENRPVPPREKRADIPPGVEEAILRCMSTSPDDRYGSVAELAVALQPFAEEGDRETVLAISRVAGREVGLMPASSRRDVAPASAGQGGTPSESIGGSLATNLTVAQDAPPAAKRTPWLVPAAGAAGIAAVAAAVLVLQGRSTAVTPSPSTSASAPPTAPSAAAAASPPLTDRPSPSASAAPPLPTTTATPSATASPASAPTPEPLPTSRGRSRAHPPVQPAQPSPSPPPQPANPMDLHLK
jgi:serine/threonine-protein kinase